MIAMSVKPALVRETIKDYAKSFFEKDISEEERCEQVAFFIRNLCLFMTNNEPSVNVFNSMCWGDNSAIANLINEARILRDYFCDYESQKLYLEMRNVLIIFLFSFLKKLRTRNKNSYHLESYIKGMLIDTVGRMPLGKATSVAYRVKGLLYDVVHYSFYVKRVTNEKSTLRSS